jgi:2-dehydro-3-deoxyphosphooctonate aldolase (KDO 8-P synthase)
MKGRVIRAGNVKIGGGNRTVFIGGPCVIESKKSALSHAKTLKKICSESDVPFIYKSSYDKSNRTSVNSYRGPGIDKGIEIIREIKETLKVPVLSDVHSVAEVEKVKDVLDIIQVPAFLCRQTDLIMAVAKTGKTVNIKKGQFLAPWDVNNIIKKIESAGNKNILLTERGVSFGYNALVSDLRSILIMKRTGYPVIYDAGHSVQIPGGLEYKSGGEREFIPHLALAAAACGTDAIFIEVHKKPDRALCDGPNMIALKDLKPLLKKIKAVEKAVK